MYILRSILTYVATAAYVLIVGPIGILFAVPFKSKRTLYLLGHGGVGLALGLAGIRYRVSGRENIPAHRAVVFCANHQSNVDPPVLFRVLHRQLHVLYKAELRKIPILGRVLEVGGFVAVQRDNRDAALASIDAAAESVRRGNSFLIFPEGTRSRTAELLPFKKGGLVMAIRAQAPVIPVAISGGRASMRKGSAFVRPVLVTVRIGAPIETAGLTIEQRDTLIAKVRSSIEELLAQEGEAAEGTLVTGG